MSVLTTTQPTHRGQKLALVIGYLALAGGVLYAYGAPATGYEISIYGSTPYGFWFGIGIALLISVFVTLSAPDGYLSLGGLLLGGGATVSLAGLPIIRNYFFYGTGDGLTHLGWTKDIFHGVLSVFGDFYPGIHTMSLFMHSVVGATIPRSMLLVVLCYVVVYIVFIPLCVRSMTSHRGAMLLGGLSGLLLLPINHLGMNYMTPHPISDSILLTPVIIYLLINYLTSPTDVFETRLPMSAVGAVFAITLGGIVLYHPQQAANLIIFFIVISFVQFVYRTLKPDSRIADHKTLYSPAVFLIGSFMLWSVGRSRYESSVDAVLRELFSFLTGGGANLGAGVASQGASLTAIGGSVLELFLKLFGVSLIFAALAGLLMLTSLFGRLRDAPDTTALVKYFTIGLVVLIPYSLVFYIGSVSDLFFRNVGLIMLFSTILGSIALYRYISGLSEIVPANGVRAVTAVVLVLMLALSAVIVFPAPYIFLPNGQVTDSQMSGYRFSFTHTDGLAVYGLRAGPWRYKHGLFGVETTDIQQNGRGISAQNISSGLAGETAEDRYLAIPDAVRKREIEVFDGLRYDRKTFSSLDDQRGVSHVYTNGGVDLYLIEGRGPSGVNGTAQAEIQTVGTGSRARGSSS
ncbi:MAG TPA: hypothetical protein VFJ06_01390 [Halococcus sp.]|nr:hypothetical protein [Halococcus sp.]